MKQIGNSSRQYDVGRISRERGKVIAYDCEIRVLGVNNGPLPRNSSYNVSAVTHKNTFIVLEYNSTNHTLSETTFGSPVVIADSNTTFHLRNKIMTKRLEYDCPEKINSQEKKAHHTT